MTLSVAVIDAIVASGCTVEQLAAIVKADLGYVEIGTAMVPGTDFHAPEGDTDVTFEGDSDISEGGPRAVEKMAAIARKQLGLVPGLTRSAARVGSAIIDHFNRKTGQCDPSIDRIAAKLRLSRRTVIRSINELHDAGLIQRVRHGGYSHRNAYTPVWRALAVSVGQWDAAMSDKSAPAMTAVSPSPQQCHPRHHDSAGTVTQTYVKNPDRKPGGWGNSARARHPDGKQREMLLVMGTPSSVAAVEAARSRVSDAIRSHLLAISKLEFATQYPRISDATWRRACQAELARKGSGLAIVVEFLGVGPPVTATA